MWWEIATGVMGINIVYVGAIRLDECFMQASIHLSIA
jgi:hypothetical protein